ncbi:MAG: HAMP domain-containing histidine kinase [Candidatus Omnitrophica bacterium]|nr:HAMP domain-containing histidine kinase [Candidatus Omnitrophota bacterium]
MSFSGSQENVEKVKAEFEKKISERTQQLEKALEELRKTQYQLVQQERLRALGQMASGIVHDFNNALSPILGYSELLLKDPQAREDRKTLLQFLQIMNAAARHAAGIVKRLRDFFYTREQNEPFTSVHLNPMIEEMISLTQPKWKSQALVKGAQITVRKELGDIPLIEGDDVQLREVLTNLIFNAVDAMPQGGELMLRTYANAYEVVLEVCDQGIGMDEEVKRRCWEPFFTTKGDSGSGLGLSVVYGVIQRHGGSVLIQSEKNKGTTFSISFSRSDDRERESS